MILRILGWLAGLLVVLMLLALIAWWKPVETSAIVWPPLETLLIETNDFVGVTTDGLPIPGLFVLQSTAFDGSEVVNAANTWLASLPARQRERATFPVTSDEWRRWANIHISTRQGVGFLEMTPQQAENGFALLRASLSAKGYETSRNIMRLEGHLADLLGNPPGYGEHRYWLTIMGEPSMTEPWGWQLDGHHLIINYFMLDSQVVITPTFMGAEPPSATRGRFAGTSILEAELDVALEFMNSLPENLRREAIFQAEKTFNNNHGELFSDNAVVPYQGLRLADLPAEHQAKARELIGLYVGNLPNTLAYHRMAEIEQHWEDTWFAWVGSHGPDSVFYYRVQSPVIMIEYDHQVPVALAGMSPSRDHVHTVVRTPNGNDYGKDLLRQHLANHPH